MATIRSPTDFHVHILRHSDTIHKIAVQCDSLGKVPNQETLDFKNGAPILAKYSVNNSWYRARVIGSRQTNPVDENSREIHVFYVDYGNREWIPVKNHDRFHSITRNLLKYPQQAVRCSLNMIYPNSKDGKWTEEGVVAFESMFGELPATACVCQQSQQSEGTQNEPWLVDIFRNKNSSRTAPESFRDALVFLGYGSFSKNAYSEQNEPSMELRSSNAGSEFVFAPLLKVQDIHMVAICHVNNPGSFFFHVLGDETNMEKAMNAKIQQFAMTQMKVERRTMPVVRSGLPVLAPFLDGKFYRSVVIKKDPVHSDQVIVRYVDYGNFTSVKASRLLNVPDEILKVPVIARLARLGKCKPIGQKWCEQSVEYMKTLKPDELIVLIDVVNRRQPYTEYVVELYDESSGKTESVANTLIHKGLALPDGPHFREVNDNVPPRGNVKSLSSSDSSSEDEEDGNHKQPEPVFVAPELSSVSSSAATSPVRTKPLPPKATPVPTFQPDAEQPVVEDAPNGVEVTLTNFVSPYDFYLRPVKLNRLVERIEYAIKLLVDGNFASSVSAAVNGEIVLVAKPQCDGDMLWMRGRVANVTAVSDPDSVASVFLLDYGSVVNVKLRDLCKLTCPELNLAAQNILSMPETTFHCAVDGVKPAGLNGNIWSKVAREFFASTFNYNPNSEKPSNPFETWAVSGGILFTDSKLKNRIPVRLYVKETIPPTPFSIEGRKYASITERLINNGYALSEISLISADVLPSELKKRSEETFEFSVPAELAKLVSLPMYAVTLNHLTSSNPVGSCSKSSSQGSMAEICPRVNVFESKNSRPVKISAMSLFSINTEMAIFHFADKHLLDTIVAECHK